MLFTSGMPTIVSAALPENNRAACLKAKEDKDYYTQPGRLFRLIGADKKVLLFENTARAIMNAPIQVKIRHIGNCMKADRDYRNGVAAALKNPLARFLNKKEARSQEQKARRWKPNTLIGGFAFLLACDSLGRLALGAPASRRHS